MKKPQSCLGLMIFIVLFCSSIQQSSAGIGDICARVFKWTSESYVGIQRGTFEDWQAAFEEAKAVGNVNGASYAMANMLLLKTNELELSPRSKRILKRQRDILEYQFEFNTVQNKWELPENGGKKFRTAKAVKRLMYRTFGFNLEYL